MSDWLDKMLPEKKNTDPLVEYMGSVYNEAISDCKAALKDKVVPVEDIEKIVDAILKKKKSKDECNCVPYHVPFHVVLRT